VYRIIIIVKRELTNDTLNPDLP